MILEFFWFEKKSAAMASKKAFLVKWKKMSKSEQNNYAKSFYDQLKDVNIYFEDFNKASFFINKNYVENNV